ncbi:MAG: amidase, partial [Rhodocyclaceae bacterium]|nr:amidase [Rhodocyclaceae bacterium]
MTAQAAAEGIREGLFSSEELVRACLTRIDTREKEVQAWAFLDPDYAISQARAADAWRKEGKPLGPLHGVPIGIKDIIDTADMPTEDGTILHAGRRPRHDAKVVELLRGAGAIILGKTATTELASLAHGKTCNPYDLSRTPGGSSSGSAAAVADGMVPLAIGTQTNGSVIRPASYCGVIGYKPSRGLISRRGILPQAPTLDQVGVFSRSVEDAALLTEVLVGYDAEEENMRPQARPPLFDICRQVPPFSPLFAWVKTPWWSKMANDAQEGFQELLDHLGDRTKEFPLPDSATRVVEWHRAVMEAELAFHYAEDYRRGKERMSVLLREQIERGHHVSATDYLSAKARISVITEALDEI